jgi:hypothetical protein
LPDFHHYNSFGKMKIAVASIKPILGLFDEKIDLAPREIETLSGFEHAGGING